MILKLYKIIYIIYCHINMIYQIHKFSILVSNTIKKRTISSSNDFHLEDVVRFELTHQGFADPRLTAWLYVHDNLYLIIFFIISQEKKNDLHKNNIKLLFKNDNFLIKIFLKCLTPIQIRQFLL